MRQTDGSVRMGSGMIHAHSEAYRPQVVARKARTFRKDSDREDLPANVREMLRLREQGKSWGAIATAFGYRTKDGPKRLVERAMDSARSGL